MLADTESPCSNLKQRILDCYEAQENRNWTSRGSDEKYYDTYVDESLLPSFREDIEYQDEYDDTYDEGNVTFW